MQSQSREIQFCDASPDKELYTSINYNFVDEDPTKLGGSDAGKKNRQLTQKNRTINTAKQTPRKESKSHRLLENTDVKRWYDNLARGSQDTAEARLHRLGHFCEVQKTTPMGYLELAKTDTLAATNLLQDHMTWMEQRGNAPGYIQNTIVAVRSWLDFNGKTLARKLKVANADSTPTLENEKVPEPAEVDEILDITPGRVGASIALMAKAGIRPRAMGNSKATDGLMMKDLPDIAIEERVAKCKQSPPRVIVRKTLSKAKFQYVTFLSPRGTEKLIAYLNARLASGEILDVESPVIAPDNEYKTHRGNNATKKFIPTAQIRRDIREALARTRFKERPYVLRRHCDIRLQIAESRGKITPSFRAYMMGHKGDIDATYTTNKPTLPESLLKELTDSYRRCVPFIDHEAKDEDPTRAIKEKLLRAIENGDMELLGKMQEMLVNQNGICNVGAKAVTIVSSA